MLCRFFTYTSLLAFDIVYILFSPILFKQTGRDRKADWWTDKQLTKRPHPVDVWTFHCQPPMHQFIIQQNTFPFFALGCQASVAWPFTISERSMQYNFIFIYCDTALSLGNIQ